MNDRLDLLRMVESLRGRDREIAIKRYIEGMSEAEIGNYYQVTESRICQRLKRIQSRLSKRVTCTKSRKSAGEMEAVLFISWERLEFEKNTRMAFEESGAMAPIDEARIREWFAPAIL